VKYWEPTISLGNVLTMVSIIIIGVKVIMEVGAIRTKVDTMWRWWERNVPRGAVAVVRGGSDVEE